VEVKNNKGAVAHKSLYGFHHAESNEYTLSYSPDKLRMSFKPGTDDVRESPTLELERDLELSGVTVTYYELVQKELISSHGDSVDLIRDI
jgi:hypothetical protein